MNTNFAYDKADILQVVEYHLIYPEEKVYPTICSLLENIPREKIVRFSQLLVNLYSNASIEDMQNFSHLKMGSLKMISISASKCKKRGNRIYIHYSPNTT